MKEPYVRKWGKLDGFTVFLVDGKWIRANKDIEYTNYDQHFHKKYIPKNEIWVDAASDAAEIQYWAESAEREARLMSRGESYDKAEKAADKAEKKLRSGDSDAHAKIREELLSRVGSLEVWLVNGRAIRDQYDVDFTEGGHSKVYKWIPKNCIYLDDEIDESELGFVFLHELLEFNRMSQGMSYEKAHHLASETEVRARRKPSTLMRYLGPELRKVGAKPSDILNGALDGKEMDSKSPV